MIHLYDLELEQPHQTASAMHLRDGVSWCLNNAYLLDQSV